MTDEEVKGDQRAIEFGQKAAQRVERVVDLYHFASIALHRWPKTLRELLRYRHLVRQYRPRIAEGEKVAKRARERMIERVYKHVNRILREQPYTGVLAAERRLRRYLRRVLP